MLRCVLCNEKVSLLLLFSLQVFREVEGTVDKFYVNSIPKDRATELIDLITSMLGEQCVTLNKRKNITNVSCHWNQLKDVENAFINKGLLGRGDAESSTNVPPIKHCLLLTELPYFAEYIAQQKSELVTCLRDEGVNVQDLICGIQGDVTKAIAIVESPEGIISN